jgi:ankyrin repeat protein
MWAAGGNQPEIVDLLLAKGAKNVDLRAKSDDWPRQMTSEPRAQFQSRQTGGLTALLYATRSGCHRCAVSLVKAGADVNKPNPDGVTPLINALDNRRFDIAMFLLDKGADPHVWDMSGRTPLYVAVDMKSFTRAGGFGAGGGGFPAAEGQRETAGPSPVTAMQVINRLLEAGVDVNHQLTRKRPYGAGRGRFEDYDLRGGVGPLFVASMRHDHEAMSALLAHGAEVDLPNVVQMTPLMMAVGTTVTGRPPGGVPPAPGGDIQARAIKTIDLLLDAGAKVNTQIIGSRTNTGILLAYVSGRDQEGRTALFTAAEGGRDRVVKHLLDRGADPSLRDAAGKTALDYARTPAPAAGPAGAAAAGAATAANRAATVAILEAATPKTGIGATTTSAR